MTATYTIQSKYFRTFLKFLVAYGVIILVLSQEGGQLFPNLHLILDTGNGMLSFLLAVFLLAEQYNIERNERLYLVIGFFLASFTEISHVMVGIEWSGIFEWISDSAQILRPATWPPSTYALPLTLACILLLRQYKAALHPAWFALGMASVTFIMYVSSLMIPPYTDTGILGVHRPTQAPLLILWVLVIIGCWRIRLRNPLYEGIAWMGMLLFLSDLCMLYSTSPHEKFAMMAHAGKLLAYLLLHHIQMKISAEDSQGRKQAEEELRLAAATFESQEGIMITDPDARILRVNQAFQDITGYSAAEVVGQNPRVFKSGRHDAAFYHDMWSALAHTGKWNGEIWDRRQNGEIYPKQMTITAVRDANHRVSQYVSVFRDISNRKKSEQAIHNLAFFDALTQLPNRRLFLDRLQQAMVVSARNSQHGALLFLDLDHFKTINDTQGHATGDLLLVEVARRLHTCVREGDSVARLGGDEFVVLLEGLSSNEEEAAGQTELIASKIRIELAHPYLLKDFDFRSTVSIGVSLFQGNRENSDTLLQHADVAMYQAKAEGRNTMCFFDPKMQQVLDARLALEADLRTALEQQQFRLYYQVQVDKLHKPLGAEALLRWEHPQRGMVSPMQFIPLAEDSGLIVPIGLWVLQTACAQIKAWQDDALTRDLTLAVNVSFKQFYQPDFVTQVQQALQESGAPPALLKLELTESIVLDNVEKTISRMLEVKELGVSFSMDDFGTGYSSLQYLKRLPLSQIKIDQSFVRDIVTDSNDAAIVQTIIAMTQTLGLNVIAEGVETEGQRDFLQLRGCNSFQGYLFSKPVPVEQFEALLRQG